MIYGGDFVLVVTAVAKFSASAICSGIILAMFLFVRLAGRPLNEDPPHNCSARGVTRSNFHTAEPQSVHTNVQSFVAWATWRPGFVHHC